MADIWGVQFDKVNDYFDLDDDPKWDIIRSNGSQFYVFWLSQDTNTGSDSQYWFSNNSFNAADSVQCYVDETDGTFHFNPANPTQSVSTSAKTFPTGKVMIVQQYNNSNTRLETSCCGEGGLNERDIATVNLSSDIQSNNWNLGRRQDGNSGRYYEGIIYNVAKGTGYLTDAQIENLASDFLNYDPNDEFTPEIYFPMNEGTGTIINDAVPLSTLKGTGIGFPGDSSQWVLEGQSGTGEVLIADSGSYSSTGTTTPLLTSFKVPVNSGSYSASGTNLNLITSRQVITSSGSYTLTGNDVGLIYTPIGESLIIDPGNYQLIGSDLLFNASYGIIASSGNYSLSGSSVSLIYSGASSQAIGTVTSSFAPDLYTSEYKPIDITVSFKE